MKNVFGYPYSKDGDTPCDGARFVTNRIDLEFKREMDSTFDAALETAAKASLPAWLTLLKAICYLGFFIVIAAVVRNIDELSLTDMLKNSPVIFIICGVCIVLWAALHIAEKARYKKVESTGEIDKTTEKMEQLDRRSEELLGIPHDRKAVDVLSFRYIEKNGKIKIKEELFSKYSNNEMKLFRDNDDLCLADLECVYSFPISGFKKYVLKKKKADMDEWNKDVPFNKGQYKQYKMTANDYDTIFCKYYALQFADVFGEYEIFFPEYELEAFKSIVDVPVEKE